MRRVDRFVTMIAVLTTACGGDAATSPRPDATTAVSPSQSSTAGERKLRPIKGSCDAAVISVVALSQTTARQVVAGPCRISHLGKTTIYFQQVIDFTTLIGTSEVVTFTAANGDVLRATAITKGTPTGPSSFSLVGTFVFTGGTGRFAHAVGRADFTGTADFVTGRALLTMSGGIDYGRTDDADDED